MIQVSATDADHGKNAEVHYYLAPEKDYTKFQIHKDTGLLTTRQVLDREQQAVFEVSLGFLCSFIFYFSKHYIL